MLEAQVLMNSSRSALKLSLYGATWAMPWGGAGVNLQGCVLYQLRRRAEGSMGTIWSSSPWMIKVGTSIRCRSSVRSVSEKALMQS
jgi:hypothetical protein